MSKPTLTLPNGETIFYQLERRQRRTIGLKITADGLVVHAPKRIYDVQLNQVLQEKAHWILNKLQAREENKTVPMQWLNGEYLLFLGNDIQLKISADKLNKAAVLEQSDLVIAQPAPLNQALTSRKVIAWYKKHAQLDFSRRLEVFAAKLGVITPPLSLSNAKSRWGSCNSRGEIRLNWRLLQAPPHIINYVICHELAHLKQMNHSAKFWAVVEKLYPDFKFAEKELKKLSPYLHRI
ncbi:MAG TPA: SprT family zinc-dependent metalloprotease [Methylotenera sp.]|nr:SprT family zinc-dependent metalloprotease [Methylotenera sp.]HPH05504.1 SprT family zinc-dependent metalloprotease [Methylotenera sp.]HPN00082.1 SprT family zinc-dependent metalloprotease [Methylotenera sp.]